MVGMDFLGKIELVADNGSQYILLVVDYFIKMVFATDSKAANSQAVYQFSDGQSAFTGTTGVILQMQKSELYFNHMELKSHTPLSHTPSLSV